MAEKKQEWLTLKQTRQILDLSPVWVRRMVKQGKLGDYRRDPAGRILVSKDRVLEKQAELEEKWRKQREGGNTPSRVPSLQSCDIIARAVENDGELTDEEKAKFVGRIEAYRQFFTARLEAIRSER